MIFPSLSRKGNEAASTATTTTDTGTPVMTMEERRRELGVDSNNLATFMKDVRELRAMGGKYYEARSELSAPEVGRIS